MVQGHFSLASLQYVYCVCMCYKSTVETPRQISKRIQINESDFASLSASVIYLTDLSRVCSSHGCFAGFFMKGIYSTSVSTLSSAETKKKYFSHPINYLYIFHIKVHDRVFLSSFIYSRVSHFCL